MELEKVKRLIALAERFAEDIALKQKAIEVIGNFLNERKDEIELEVDEWICPGCGFVYARNVTGVLRVPQPEDGLLTCTLRCQAKWKTEDGIAQVVWFKNTKEGDVGTRPQPEPVEGTIWGR
jgi:hypothetical protein